MANIKKPKLVKNNEKTLGVFSSIRFDFPDNSIYKFIDNRDFYVVWSEASTSIDNGKTIFNKKIYKTKQGFYLYLLLGDVGSNLVVYYKQDQFDELTIFIIQLLKQFNNDKTTNK
jgi:hypothetical protein